MPAALSKLKKKDIYPRFSLSEYNWYTNSRDNPKDIVKTPHIRELERWKKVINGIQSTDKKIREAQQQGSLNCTTKKNLAKEKGHYG